MEKKTEECPLRNDMAKVIEILELPEATFLLFGMVTGYPAHEGSKKERLPVEAVYHENKEETA